MPRFLALARGSIDSFHDQELAARGLLIAGVKPLIDATKSMFGQRVLQAAVNGDTATVEVIGSLYASVPLNLRLFGKAATSTRELRSVMDELAANPAVATINLVMDSPGGEVTGTFEAAAAIGRAQAAGKVVNCQASGCLASAAYLIASACDSIACTPMTEVGSIGVVAVLADTSAKDASNGVKRVVISSGENKGLGMDGVVTDAAIAATQARVDQLAAAFAAQVATGRKLSAEVVAALATGDTWLAHQAVALGLIDAADPATAAFNVGADDGDGNDNDDDTGMHAALTPPVSSLPPMAVAGPETAMSLLALCAEFPAYAAEINTLALAKTSEDAITTQIRTKAGKAALDAKDAEIAALKTAHETAKAEIATLKAANTQTTTLLGQKIGSVPDPGTGVAASKIKTGDEFLDLSPTERSEFRKAGGIVRDA